MAWCPKCRNEYREGITICSDCGIPLVDELEDDSKVPLMYGQGDQLNALKGFMEYSGLKGVELRFNEQESYYELFVKKEDQKTAIGMASVFVRQLEQQNKEDNKEMSQNTADNKEPENAETQQQPVKPFVYQSSAEKAQDNKSSGFMLIVVGVLGLGAIGLCMAGIIPFRMGGATYMFYGVMSTIFILFAIMGAVSLKNAKIFAQNVKNEDSLKQTLVDWCKANFSAAEIDRIMGIQGETDEELYFKRYAYMKERLNQQFLTLDQAFLEQILDNEIYEMVFSDKQ